MQDDLVARLRAAGCVFAEDEAALLRQAAASSSDLERLVALRVSGLPLEHVVGWVDFAGHRTVIDPGVFVPRPRTQLLVEAARAAVTRGAIVLDLCCGSGAIGVAVTADIDAELVATDIDPTAVANARRNVEPLGGQVFEGDLFGGLPDALKGRIDVITVIAPYVPTTAIALLPHEARDFEPLSALDGGADGLDVVRRILAQAPLWLAPGGRLFTEVSEAQLDATVAIANASHLTASVVSHEEADAWVVVASRP